MESYDGGKGREAKREEHSTEQSLGSLGDSESNLVWLEPREVGGAKLEREA